MVVEAIVLSSGKQFSFDWSWLSSKVKNNLDWTGIRLSRWVERNFSLIRLNFLLIRSQFWAKWQLVLFLVGCVFLMNRSRFFKSRWPKLSLGSCLCLDYKSTFSKWKSVFHLVKTMLLKLPKTWERINSRKNQVLIGLLIFFVLTGNQHPFEWKVILWSKFIK